MFVPSQIFCWLYFASLRNRLSWNIHVLGRYPPAAVDPSKSCTPARGGGAHQSGVPGFKWALRRKRYSPKTSRILLFFMKCVCESLHFAHQRLDGEAAPCVSSCCDLPVWRVRLGRRRQVCPWWWDLAPVFSARFLSQGGRDAAAILQGPWCWHKENDEPSFLWQVFFHQRVLSRFCLCFCPLRQDSSTRSWGASWPSASRLTSSTETRRPRPKWVKSVAWRVSTIRSSSRIYSQRLVCIVKVFVHWLASHE